MKQILRKLNSRKGESIAEVLIALLISALGIVLLGGMIASAVRMINASRDTVADYIHAENVLAERSAASSLDGTLTFKDGAGQARKLTDASSSAAGTDIVYYVNEVIPATTVAAYRKDE